MSITVLLLSTWLLIVSGLPIFAAVLIVDGENGKTYDGGTYDYFTITNSIDITIRNAAFSAPSSIKGSNTILVEKCDFDGQQDINNCNALLVKNCDNVIIQNNKIHDFADDGIVLYSIKDVKCIGNDIYRLMARGTDGQAGNGPCYNGHSDAFEPMDFTNLEISGNICHEYKGTAGMFILPPNLGSTHRFAENTNLVMKNNLWYLPGTGAAFFVKDVNGVTMYNNTLWSRNSAGLIVYPTARKIVARNNIFSAINFNMHGANPNSSEYDFDYNVIGASGQGFPVKAHDIVAANPLFARIPARNATVITNVIAADFVLKAGSPAIRGVAKLGS